MRHLWKHAVTLLGLLPIVACDVNRAGSTGVSGSTAPAAAAPDVVGSYTGTAAAHVRTSLGRNADVACPVRIDIASQRDANFSGSVAIQQTRGCNTESVTIDGIVRADGTITVLADAPGGGANVFEDAALRAGCALVRSSGTFGGSISGGAFSATGDAVYDCHNRFGTFRALIDARVSATRP